MFVIQRIAVCVLLNHNVRVIFVWCGVITVREKRPPLGNIFFVDVFGTLQGLLLKPACCMPVAGIWNDPR